MHFRYVYCEIQDTKIRCVPIIIVGCRWQNDLHRVVHTHSILWRVCCCYRRWCEMTYDETPYIARVYVLLLDGGGFSAAWYTVCNAHWYLYLCVRHLTHTHIRRSFFYFDSVCVCVYWCAGCLIVLLECFGYVNVIGIESVNARKSIHSLFSMFTFCVVCSFPLLSSVSWSERKVVWVSCKFFSIHIFFILLCLNAVLWRDTPRMVSITIT